MRFLFNIQPRYILLLSGIIAVIMIFGGIYQAQESRSEIYQVLQKEAFSLIETIERASTNIILSSDEIELQIADRLLTAGRFLADLDSIEKVQTSTLRRIAARNKIYRIDIIDAAGHVILSNRPIHHAP